MQNVNRKLKIWGVLLFLLFFVTGISMYFTAANVHAETKTGFVTINGKSYYINEDGSKQKGWLELNGKKYYFNATTGVQVKGWATDSKGRKRYFSKNAGVMLTGWLTDSKDQKRYFDPSTGFMQTKWLTLNGRKYYFYSNSGVVPAKHSLQTVKITRDILPVHVICLPDGLRIQIMSTDISKQKMESWQKDSRHLTERNIILVQAVGKMAVGWTTISGNKYYFDKETGVMATGDVTIDGTKYHFTSDGVLNNTTTPTGSKTIKNYLAGALQPVGQALYVWGGGWNDSTRKGTSQTMTDFYNSQSSSYDYNNYRDLSTANRAKGFDCSGFVGWAAYQVMQSKSGVGSGYTVVSGEIGSYYKSMGWGSILTQANLASDDWTVYPGDVGYDSGHTWIILGQCKDKSAVIVHSTPNAGVQIAGTPTPSGDYSSQAITLAQKYMSRYPGFTKYAYHTSSGNYIRRGNYLRWNRSTLSDPDGYLNMTADQILADLFS